MSLSADGRSVTGSQDLGTRDRLVLAAAELLRQRGYAATGVKVILTTSGAPSGSLYHFFPMGKEQLAAEAIRSSGRAYLELVESYFPPGAELSTCVTAFFTDAADMLESTGFTDACPIASVALETASHSRQIRLAASEAFSSWIAVIADRAIESGVDQESADQIASELFMLLQGAFLLARVNRDETPLRRAASTAARMTRDAMHAPAGGH